MDGKDFLFWKTENQSKNPLWMIQLKHQ